MANPASRRRGGALRLGFLLFSPLLAGCSFGPHVLESSHGRYQESMKQVRDEEFLRNLVRLRYEDSLNILDVASIASQFELNASAEARPFTVGASSNGNFRTWSPVLPFAGVQGSNRPTFTMVPREDSETVQRYLAPVAPESIVFFVASGWPVSNIFRLWLDELNHIPNAVAPGGEGSVRGALPDYQRFRRIVDLLQWLVDQRAATFSAETHDTPLGCPLPTTSVTSDSQVEAAKSGMRYAEGPTPGTCVLTKGQRKLVLKIHPLGMGLPELEELCRLLGLQPGLPEYDLTVGELEPYPRTFPPEPLSRIDLAPRSTVKALHYLSHGVAVPPDHLAAGVARTAMGPDGTPFNWQQLTEGLFTVCYSPQHKRPEQAYVAVRYRGYWFYIDDRDTVSKSTFNLMLQLTRIDIGYASARAQQTIPVLTLPVGR